jgi:molybdate transport system ATP-binding protein
VSPGLQVDLAVRRGDFALDAGLRVGPGEVVAVLGRNGSGKSTLLAAIAGLLRPDTGRIVLNGRTLTDTAAGVQLAPHRRRVGLLAQEPLLFPHLSVLDNVAFGPRAAGARKQPARSAAMRHLTEVDAVEFAPRRPRRLSGGQAQRIALARALASEPELLLLDEPLSAVDVELAPALRSLLRSVLQDRLVIVVTHQVIDALVLADRVVVMEGGRVVEQGPTHDVLTRPRSAFAARLAGLNLVAGTATASGLRAADDTELSGVCDSTVAGAPAVAVFSPTAVAVYTDPPKGSPRNVIQDRVTVLEPNGSFVRARGAGGLAADITPVAAVELGLHTDAQVWFVVKATEVAIYPTNGSRRTVPGDVDSASHAVSGRHAPISEADHR